MLIRRKNIDFKKRSTTLFMHDILWLKYKKKTIGIFSLLINLTMRQ